MVYNIFIFSRFKNHFGSSMNMYFSDARKNKEQSTLPKEEFKTFDGGHFKIASPLIQTHVPRRKSDANNSLLRQVMSSGSKRITPKLSVNASLNAVRKSVLARTISSSPAIVVSIECMLTKILSNIYSAQSREFFPSRVCRVLKNNIYKAAFRESEQAFRIKLKIYQRKRRKQRSLQLFLLIYKHNL